MDCNGQSSISLDIFLAALSSSDGSTIDSEKRLECLRLCHRMTYGKVETRMPVEINGENVNNKSICTHRFIYAALVFYH